MTRIPARTPAKPFALVTAPPPPSNRLASRARFLIQRSVSCASHPALSRPRSQRRLPYPRPHQGRPSLPVVCAALSKAEGRSSA
jgi:hypothetical protein